MKFNSNSLVKPLYFEKDGTKSILSFDINNDEVIMTSFPYFKNVKRNFSFVITKNLSNEYKELANRLKEMVSRNHFEAAVDKNFDEIEIFDANCFEFNFLTDIINKTLRDNNYLIVVTRKVGLSYRYSETNILGSFKDKVVSYGNLNIEPEEIFGDTYYAGVFENIGEMKTFEEFIQELNPIKSSKQRKSFMLTGEDIDMFHEREQESKSKTKEAICDTHMDGA